MALHPFREALGQAGLRASRNPSTFKPAADAALANFQAVHGDLERQVKRGDLTIKVAKEKARTAAETLRNDLIAQARGHSEVPRAFLDRLAETSLARKKAREHQSVEALQRETNRLLRQTLVEQQLGSRAEEFEGRTFVRMMPGGKAAPTLQTLLAFHQQAADAGDEAAQEWARRQLEGMRSRVAEPADIARIDQACDRPDRVNPRTVARLVQAIEGAPHEDLERFVAEAVEARDSNACVAAFLAAREAQGGTANRWVRQVLTGVSSFPDAALGTLRGLEADARAAEVEAATAQAEYAAAIAESLVRFPGLEAPSRPEVDRVSRLEARPVARLGEPIGLALNRRGAASPAELQAAAEVEAEGQDPAES
ncbi:MAG: hypothetical protein U0835_16750 [Isosphaeraceae bacterium]